MVNRARISVHFFVYVMVCGLKVFKFAFAYLKGPESSNKHNARFVLSILDCFLCSQARLPLLINGGFGPKGVLFEMGKPD